MLIGNGDGDGEKLAIRVDGAVVSTQYAATNIRHCLGFPNENNEN